MSLAHSPSKKRLRAVDTEQRAFNLTEAGQKLGVHARTIRNMIDRGDLETVQIGRRQKVTAEEIDRILNLSEDDPTKFCPTRGLNVLLKTRLKFDPEPGTLDRILAHLKIEDYGGHITNRDDIRASKWILDPKNRYKLHQFDKRERQLAELRGEA